jgi:hypothetical protein
MDGVCGLIAIDASAAGFTVSCAEALIPARLIPIIVTPVVSVLAKPAVFVVLLIVATWDTLELQCPDCVTSCVDPSVNVATAVNDCVVPSGIVEDNGLMAIETGTAVVTVTIAEPVRAAALAVIVAVPVAMVFAIPV